MTSIASPTFSKSNGSNARHFAATAASVLTVAAILFVGSRDWKSGRPVLKSLVDISDIQQVFSSVENAGSATTARSVAIAQATTQVERSMIEHGTLVRRNTQFVSTPSAVPGLHRAGSLGR